MEVAGEDGTGGYLWYLKAEGETRMRFTDNLEMTCLEGVQIANDTTLDTQTNGGALPQGGTEGLFSAV